MAESNPRIRYQMTTERAKLKPLREKPLMVHVVVNVEYWPFDQAMPRGAIPAPHGKIPIPDVANYSWVEYGMRSGMPRIMRILAERGIQASAFMNAYCADVYPSCAEAMLKADWEFVGHGWIQRSLSVEKDEAAVIERSLERLERLTGRKTRGWLGPGLGETFHTPDILKARGIEWLADWHVDDLPCWITTKHGPMVAIPYTLDITDVPIWVIQGHRSDEMLRRVEATLPVLDDELVDNPRVLTIALHPHVVGVAHRAHFLARTLDLLCERDDAIFVTGSEVADWFAKTDGG